MGDSHLLAYHNMHWQRKKQTVASAIQRRPSVLGKKLGSRSVTSPAVVGSNQERGSTITGLDSKARKGDMMADKKVDRYRPEGALRPTQLPKTALPSPGTVNMADPTHDKGKSSILDKFRKREERWRSEQSRHDREAAGMARRFITKASLRSRSRGEPRHRRRRCEVIDSLAVAKEKLKTLAGARLSGGEILSVTVSTSRLDDWRQSAPRLPAQRVQPGDQGARSGRRQKRRLQADLDYVLDLLKYDVMSRTQGLAVFTDGGSGSQRADRTASTPDQLAGDRAVATRATRGARPLPARTLRACRGQPGRVEPVSWWTNGEWPARTTSPVRGCAAATARRARCP